MFFTNKLVLSLISHDPICARRDDDVHHMIYSPETDKQV